MHNNVEWTIGNKNETNVLKIGMIPGTEIIARIQYVYEIGFGAASWTDKDERGFSTFKCNLIKGSIQMKTPKKTINQFDIQKTKPKFAIMFPNDILAHESTLRINWILPPVPATISSPKYIPFYKIIGHGKLFMACEKGVSSHTLKLANEHFDCDVRRVVVFSIGSKLERLPGPSKEVYFVRFFGPCQIYFQSRDKI